MAPPSLHRVPAGRVSRLQRYYEALRLPHAHTRQLMGSLPGLRSSLLFSFCREGERLPEPGSVFTVPCHRPIPPGTCGPLRFLGCPSCAFAVLSSDPGRTPAPHSFSAAVLPPQPIQRRLQLVTEFSRLNRTALAPAVYASSRGLPHRGARLASGWRCAFAGRESNPLGIKEGFGPSVRHGRPPSSGFA